MKVIHAAHIKGAEEDIWAIECERKRRPEKTAYRQSSWLIPLTTYH